MATIATLEKRISGKIRQLEQLNKKLTRIKAVEATDWKKNPYSYTETDLRYTEQDIRECQAALEKYQCDLEYAREKAASRNVSAILEFLNQWKVRCFEFYNEGLREAFDGKAEIKELSAQMNACQYGTDEYEFAWQKYTSACDKLRIRLHGRYEDQIIERNHRKFRTKVKIEDGDLEYIAPLMKESYESSIEKLRRDLDNEANNKYDFIIERTVNIVGTIIDASNLSIGDKGNLNGYIIGEKGRASVQTIGAGGYNIQCFHFRTLIHKM